MYSSASYCAGFGANMRDLEVLRPEVDSGGYDLALETDTARLYRSRSTSMHSTGRRSMKSNSALDALCPQR